MARRVKRSVPIRYPWEVLTPIAHHKVSPLQGFNCTQVCVYTCVNTKTPLCFIIPHVKIVSRDWPFHHVHQQNVHGSHWIYRQSWLFSLIFYQIGFVRYNKTNMPCQCGYLDGMSPLKRMVFHPPSGRHSIRIPTLAWHICIMCIC